jgi:hypothetical protein
MWKALGTKCHLGKILSDCDRQKFGEEVCQAEGESEQ